MTNKANILLQNYVDSVWNYRLERDSGNEPVSEEAAMDRAEAELTQYINEVEKNSADHIKYKVSLYKQLYPGQPLPKELEPTE